MLALTTLSAVGALLSAPHGRWQTRNPCASISASISAEESNALETVVAITSSFKQFGIDNGDQRRSNELTAAVYELYDVMPTEPPIAEDPRLVGDWVLVGVTGLDMIARKGLTGLGAAPFTNIDSLHVSFTAEGKVMAKETLTFFGKPVILNELRGAVSFTDDGDSMRESYDVADLGGQANSPAFSGTEFTLLESAITSCGTYRLGRDDGTGVFVFKKMREGELLEWLNEVQLPASGGTYIGNPTWKGPVEKAPQ